MPIGIMTNINHGKYHCSQRDDPYYIKWNALLNISQQHRIAFDTSDTKLGNNAQAHITRLIDLKIGSFYCVVKILSYIYLFKLQGRSNLLVR